MVSTRTATYDLVVLLDTAAEEKARATILADVERAIATDGELVRHDEWGERALAYPIGHRERAEYHLFQFHPASTDLLAGLDRSLRITDGVIRFRIVKLAPGTPDPPESLRAGRAEEPQSARGEDAHVGERPSDGPGRAAPAATEPAATEPAATEPAAEGGGGRPATAADDDAPAGEAPAPAAAGAPTTDAPGTSQPAGEAS